jgi:hypothetical protein
MASFGCRQAADRSSLGSKKLANRADAAGRTGKCAAAEVYVRLTVQRLTRAARAHVATAERHAACLHVKSAMQAA